jgi:hypothetical protein
MVLQFQILMFKECLELMCVLHKKFSNVDFIEWCVLFAHFKI